MEVLYARCAGLDVHKDQVTACRRIVDDGKVTQEVQVFATMTSGLLALADWLTEAQCTHVVMEATGVYWKPVWHVLEASFELVLANAQHVRNVPGRKSDVSDAMWLADLLAHGLVRGSFVPPTPVQEMRDLTRTRKQLVREIVRHTQRIQKILEDANIKLGSVISDILGASGRAFLAALIGGETDPEKLAALAHPRLQVGRRQLVEALRGRVTPHHRFLLQLHLGQIDALEKAVRDLEARMGDALAPFREQIEHLKTFLRIKNRRGAKKAILAVAASILTAVYHMLRDNHPYRDLGSDHFDQRDKQKVAKRLLKRLGDLGYEVEVKAAA